MKLRPARISAAIIARLDAERPASAITNLAGNSVDRSVKRETGIGAHYEQVQEIREIMRYSALSDAADAR